MASRPAAPGIAAIIAAVLLPPLGVYLRERLSTAFWIDVVLTLIAWVPGIVFALLVLLRPDLLPAGWRRPAPR